MGRYRPPIQPRSPYITPEGYQRLRQESEELWQRRREVTRALAAAAAEGDRSENAEYIYRKKELREIDRRIRYLQRRLPTLKVVERPPDDRHRIFFGAWVELEDSRGKRIQYRIVGSDEFDTRAEYISMDSPLARALLRRGLDEEVSLETPGGTANYWVVTIEYR
ncbi:MAG: transcription elongation factor GreB [Pseudomonadota bacterium]